MTRALKEGFILAELLTRYCKLIGHKYPDHICSKCNGEDNIIPDLMDKSEIQSDISDSMAKQEAKFISTLKTGRKLLYYAIIMLKPVGKEAV
ncbi:hypothetical protein H5410_031126 [Solanum commersonii]|uniref:Uncharacterized protein n=1 Tax=Solanum commersonii TaxID=4109 RepID=A0A9J5YKS0_SOLCO|nr:hypothetical protein H5410_031126 [Solanum commersonii]